MDMKEKTRNTARKMAKRKRGVSAAELSEKLGRGSRGNGPSTRLLKGLVTKGELAAGEDGRFYADVPSGIAKAAPKKTKKANASKKTKKANASKKAEEEQGAELVSELLSVAASLQKLAKQLAA